MPGSSSTAMPGHDERDMTALNLAIEKTPLER